MRKTTLIVFSVFAVFTVTAIGCADNHDDHRKARIRTSKPAQRAGKAGPAAVDTQGGQQTPAAPGGSATTSAQGPDVLKREEMALADIRKVLDGILNSGAKVSKEQIPDSNYEIATVLRGMKLQNGDGLLVQRAEVKAGADSSLTMEFAQEVRTPNLKTFKANNYFPYNFPTRFEVKGGNFVVTSTGQLRSKVEALGARAQATGNDILIENTDATNAHVFGRLLETNRKFAQGVYSSGNAVNQQAIALIGSPQYLVVSEDEIAGRNSQFFILVYKQVAATPAAPATASAAPEAPATPEAPQAPEAAAPADSAAAAPVDSSPIAIGAPGTYGPN